MWDVIAALAGAIVVGTLVFLTVASRPRHLIVRRRWLGPWTAREERIKRAAAADVEAVEEDAKLVRPGAPGDDADEL